MLASLQASVFTTKKEVCVCILCQLFIPVSLIREGRAWETISLGWRKNGFRKVGGDLWLCVVHGCVESGAFHIQGPMKRMDRTCQKKEDEDLETGVLEES